MNLHNKTFHLVLVFIGLAAITANVFAARTPYTLTASQQVVAPIAVGTVSAPLNFTVRNDSAQSTIMYVDWQANSLNWQLNQKTTCKLAAVSNATESKFVLPGGSSCDLVGTFLPENIGAQKFSAQLFIHEGKLLSTAPQAMNIQVVIKPVPPTPPTPKTEVSVSLKTSFPSKVTVGRLISATYNLVSNVKLSAVSATLPNTVNGAIEVGCTNGIAANQACPITVKVNTPIAGVFPGFKPSIKATLSNGDQYSVPANNIDATNMYVVTNDIAYTSVTLTQNFTQGRVLVNTAAPTAIYTLDASYPMNNVVIQNLPAGIHSSNNCNHVVNCTIILTPDMSAASSIPATVPSITVNGQPVDNVEQFDGLEITDKVDLFESTVTSFPKYAVVGNTIKATYYLENQDALLAGINSAAVTNLADGMTSDIAANCMAGVSSCEFHISYTPAQVTKIKDFQPKILINNAYTVLTQGFTPDSISVLSLTSLIQVNAPIEKLVVDPFTNNMFLLTKQLDLTKENAQKLLQSQDGGKTWSEINLGNLATIIENNSTAYISDFVVVNNNIYAIGRHEKTNPPSWASMVIVSPVQPTLNWNGFENGEFDLAFRFSLNIYISPDKSKISLYALSIDTIYEKSLTIANTKWQPIRALNSQIFNGSLLLSKDSGNLYSQYVTKLNKTVTGRYFIYSPVASTGAAWNWQVDKGYESSKTCSSQDQLAVQYDSVNHADIIYSLPTGCPTLGSLKKQTTRNANFVPVTLPTTDAIVSIAANDDLLVVGTLRNVFVSIDHGLNWLNLTPASMSLPVTKVAITADGVMMVSDSNNMIYETSID